MRNAARIQSVKVADNALPKPNSSNTSDEPFRFKGNLLVYRQEFASLRPANSSKAAGSSISSLVQRHNTKKTRLVSRLFQPSASDSSPADSLQEVNQTQRSSFLGSRGRTIAAMVACGLIGFGIGSFWVFPTEQVPVTETTAAEPLAKTPLSPNLSDSVLSSSVTSADATLGPTTAALVDKTTDETNIEALEKRIIESARAAAEYRGEVAWLRNQNSSLSTDNAALIEESLGLNRELLDLETTVVALQDKIDSGLTIETQVVYNFVNVPIGSDPDDGYTTETDNPVADRKVSKSSYSNTPKVFEDSSEADELSE